MNEIKNDKVILPYVIDSVEPVWHIFAIRCKERDALADYLKEAGIGTNKHYPIIDFWEYSVEGEYSGSDPMR